MSNLLKISNIKNFTVFFSIALYIFLLIKIQFIDKTIILSDSVLIENCSDFSIFYLFENLLSFQNVRITFLDLNLKSSLPGSFINIEELVCIGRSIQLNGDISQNIIIGFDSYINNYFYIGIKSILFLFLIKSKNQVPLVLNILFDYSILFLWGIGVSFVTQLNFLIIVYVYAFLRKFDYKLPKLKDIHILQKRIVLIYLSTIFVIVANKIFQTEYMIGYWLANYNYGFIKRGMAGHFLYLVSSISEKISLVAVINIFVTCLYVILFYYIYYFFNSQKQNYLSYLLLISPAFISFFIIDDVLIGRPEILGVLSFLFLYKNYHKNSNLMYISTIVFFAISFFSHSINIFIALIGITFLLNKNNFEFNPKVLLEAVLIIVVILVFIFSFLNNNDTQYIEKSLCADAQSLNIRDNICDGAIGWLGYTASNNIVNISFWQDSNQRFYKSYVLIFILALFPIFKSEWLKTNKKTFLLRTLCLLPIFYLAYDWGRYFWIFIFLNSIMFFYENTEDHSELTFEKIYYMILFASLWYLPGARGIRWDNWSQNLPSRVFICYIFILLLVNTKVKINEKS